MPWVNYHSHSLFCDGKAAPEEFITNAVSRGFKAYGYSSHAPVPFASSWNMTASKFPEYLSEIGRIKRAFADKIEVYAGIEADYIEGLWGIHAAGLKNQDLDYIIGSVHYIGSLPDGSHFCFDGQPEAFFKGIEEIYQNDFRKAITAYYHALIRMVETDTPDIIGHLDKIKMHNQVKNYVNEQDKWYTALVDELLEVIRQKGCIVEVNTRGLYKRNPPLLYPGEWVLKRIYRNKIPVMLNSDAHHPSEIESGFSSAAKLLLELGFKTLRILSGWKWKDYAFTEEGLLL